MEISEHSHMEFPSSRHKNLQNRTSLFAKDVRTWVRTIKKRLECMDDLDQLIRSSGSVAANYVEADEAVSKNDFAHRCKLCRKEAKESVLWLFLLEEAVTTPTQELERKKLLQEAREFVLIFNAIVRKTGHEHLASSDDQS